MAHFGHFGAIFMHVVHKTKFVIFLHKTRKVDVKNLKISIIYYICLMSRLYLAAEGDTADRKA